MDKQAWKKACEVCGNEIPADAAVCPYCETRQGGVVSARARRKVRTINLEWGLPSVMEALRRLDREMTRAVQDGVLIVRIIHGWGSSGKGGKLRQAVRAYVAREARLGRCRAVIYGNEYFRGHPVVRTWMRQWPDLRSGERTDTRNPGVTFVEL